jgi:prevent-host-death family protein
MSDITDTQPLEDLRDHPSALIEQLKSTHRPILLTLDGHPAAVLQDPAQYQRLLDLAALAEEEQAIQQGLDDMDAGRTQPLDEVFAELRRKHAIPR